MRPYLAIIQDGFRQAFKSWILWVLLALITFLLLGAAPIGYRQELTVGLPDGSVRDPLQFLNRVKADASSDETNPSQLIWSRLDDKLRDDLENLKPPKNDGNVRKAFEFAGKVEGFVKAVENQMSKTDFYQEDTWVGVRLTSTEATGLLERFENEDEDLSDIEVQRMNRLLVEAAFPDQVRVSPRTSLQLRYLFSDIGPALPIGRKQFSDLLAQGLIAIMGWVIGGAGILVAIVVTAPIIPQMFDPGSLNLLLSKPVSRSLLFLSKFLAGCAFILILAGYLIGGAWLILGLRFGMWDPKMLWSIPIYTFVFAVYYSVSALAGVVYRSSILASAIMSIAISCMFWLVCFLVGYAKGSLENNILNKERLTQLVPAGDDLFAVDELSFVSLWDADENSWKGVFETTERQQLRQAKFLLPAMPPELRPVGPLFDKKGNRLLSVQRSFSEGTVSVYVGTREARTISRSDGNEVTSESWEPIPGAPAPSGTLALFRDPDDKVIAVSSLGIFEMRGDPSKSSQQLKVLGMRIPTGGGPFKSIGPEPAVIITQPSAISMNPDNGNLAIYSRGKLTVLRKTETGKYERQGDEWTLDEDGGLIVAAYGGNRVLIGREDGTISLLDDTTGEEVLQYGAEEDIPPRFAYAAPGGGQFAIVYHDGTLAMLDVEAETLTSPPVTGQGDISAVTFENGEQMMVVDRTRRVTRYDMESWKVLERFSPKMEFMERSYRYVFVPLYTVFPKPGELNTTLQYVLSGEKLTTNRLSAENLSLSRGRIRPWAPLWSSLAFTVVVLLIACVYIERQQF